MTTRPPDEPARVVWRLASGDRRVALTFDAGSDTGHTVRILDLLAARGIRAAFGVTGRWAEANPDLVRRISAEGHTLVNHSYDHPSFTGRSTGTAALDGVERRRQIERTEAVIQSIAGTTTRPWFRPPYGDHDDSVVEDARAAGHPLVLLWTIDSLGWKGLPAGEVTGRVLSRAEPGAIILFHVGAASTDLDALEAILDGLSARGYRCVSLGDE